MVNVFYNKDIFEKLNLEVPKTWAELEVVLQTLKENNITPFTVGGLDKWPVDHYLFTLADTAVPFDEIYTTWRAQKGANYTSPGWVKSLSIMKDWVDKGYFEDGFQGLKYDDARNNFLAGNAAMHIDGTWSTSNVLANAAFEPGFFALPQVDASLPWHSVLGPNNFWVITKASPNTEAAADYVGYMLSEEVAKAKWAAGDIPMFKFATLPEATSDLQVDIYKATGVTGPGFYMFQNSGSLGQVFEDQTALTLDGKATPEQALAEVQTALDKILAERGIQ